MSLDEKVCPVNAKSGPVRSFHNDLINFASLAIDDQFIDGANRFSAHINYLRVYEFGQLFHCFTLFVNTKEMQDMFQLPMEAR